MAKPLAIQTGGGIKARTLTFSPAARRAWIAFYDHVESQLRGPYEPIKGLANKLAEHAGRLAGVLTAVSDVDAPAIEVSEIEAGAELARHYANEALRLSQGGNVSPELRLVQKVLVWLQGRGEPLFCSTHLYQYGPAGVRDKATASRVLSVLADHGHIEPVAGGVEIDGKWRKGVWRLVSC